MLLQGCCSRPAGPATTVSSSASSDGPIRGSELGFGSDTDVMYVYRATTAEPAAAQRRAEAGRRGCSGGTRRTLKPAARPRREPAAGGKNGAVAVRSTPIARTTSAGRSPGRPRHCSGRGEWPATPPCSPTSSTGRHRAIPGGDRRAAGPRGQAHQSAGRVGAAAAGRRPQPPPEARTRLPQRCGVVRPALQLEHGAEFPSLRTTSTLDALSAAAEHGFMNASDAQTLRDAWIIASRVRSAITLWSGKTADVLPTDRQQLDGWLAFSATGQARVSSGLPQDDPPGEGVFEAGTAPQPPTSPRSERRRAGPERGEEPLPDKCNEQVTTKRTCGEIRLKCLYPRFRDRRPRLGG
jgi:glutamate-ammonia-ligase adenylyltransferase